MFKSFQLKYKNSTKIASIVCIGLAGFLLTGCDIVYRMLDKEGAEEKELVGIILPFEKNPTVEEIQILLKIYGYNVGEADGMLGLRTRNGIERFQKDYDLKPTRFADAQTWSKLKIFRDNGFVQDGKLNVKLIQTSLNASGIDAGKVDGKMGPKTLRAVKKFQKQSDLKVDGKIGYATLTALSKYLL